MVGPGFGDFRNFQPGAGTGMGYDDLKNIEARKFLEAYIGGPAVNSNIHDAVASARVISAAEKSAGSRQWEAVEPVDGTTSATK
jgi:predicted dehydrogenase